jgi:hypothetical protein
MAPTPVGSDIHQIFTSADKIAIPTPSFDIFLEVAEFESDCDCFTSQINWATCSNRLLCFGVIEKNVFSRNLCDIISFPIDQAVKGGSDLTTFFRTSVAQPQPGYDVCSFMQATTHSTFFFSLPVFYYSSRTRPH